jgi:hypothetical protein
MILRRLVLFLAAGLTGGCTATSNRSASAKSIGNQVEFDRYVEQRSATLLTMGAFKNASEAQAKAYSEASNRYGPRPGDSVTFFSTKRRSEPVDPATLDEIARKR